MSEDRDVLERRMLALAAMWQAESETPCHTVTPEGQAIEALVNMALRKCARELRNALACSCDPAAKEVPHEPGR